MKITVKILENGEEILNKVLGEGSYRAGRSEFCDLVLKGDLVSRSHIELRVTESNVYMTNMSSAGRVKVNNERVETAEIKDGDEIQIGPYKIYIFHGEMDAPAALEPEKLAAPEEESPAFKLDEAPKEEVPAEAPVEEFKADVVQMPIPSGPKYEEYPIEGTAALQRAETVVEAKPIVARLLFTEGIKAGDEMPLEAYEVTFGRSKKADVFLDDIKLSRKHCKIARVGMGYRLIDLGSRNGTFVNGMRVLEHPLASFDVIEIGDTKIKFLIVDLGVGGVANAALTPLNTAGEPVDTASLQLDPDEQAELLELQRQGPEFPPSRPVFGGYQPREARSRVGLYVVGIVLLAALYFLIPQGNQKGGADKKAGAEGTELAGTKPESPGLPKGYSELSPEMQRSIEGHYNSAVRAGEDGRYDEALIHLNAIHDSLGFYKNSRELLEQYSGKLKEKQIANAKEKAERDQKADLALYLEDGLEYLREGDFDRAAEAFNGAILLDPKNDTALKGLRAADLKIKDIANLPPETDPEDEKKKQVSSLFQEAVAAFTNKEYQKAIDRAESIRKIEIKGDTQYLNEAKQIIDRAKMMQKEEFEPFLVDAKSRYAEGDYSASRDLCEEMLKRDAAYEEAKDCVVKAKKQLNRLAKEAYTHGYILESMNRIEEAKQYWNRAKNYVRPGDDYYDKVIKKLEHYQ